MKKRLFIYLSILAVTLNTGSIAYSDTVSKESFKDLQRQMKELNKRLYNNQSTISILQKNLKRKEEEIQKIQQESNIIDDFTKKISDLESTIKKHEKELSQKTKLEAKQQENFHSIQNKLSTADSILKDKIKSEADLIVENNHLKEKVSQALKENKALSQKVASLSKKFSSEESAALKSAEIKTSSLEEEVSVLKDKLAALQKDLTEKESTSLWLIKKREELVQKKDLLDKSQKESIEKISQMRDELSKQKKDYEEIISELKSDYENELLKLTGTHEKEVSSLKNAKKDELSKLGTIYEGDVDKLKNMWAIEKASLEKSLQAALTNTSADYELQLEQAQTKINEKDTILREYKKRLEATEKQLATSNKEREDLDSLMLEIGQKYSDLEGSVDDKIAAIKKPLEEKIIVLKTQLSETRKTFDERVDSAKKPLAERVKDSKLKISELEGLVKLKEKEIKEKNKLELNLRKQINLSEVKNIALKNEIEQLAGEHTKAGQILSDYEETLEENEALKEELAQLNREVVRIKDSTQEQNNIIEQPLINELNQMKRQYTRLEEQKSSLNEMIDQLNQEKEDLFYELNKSEQENENLITEIQLLQQKIEKISSLPPLTIKPFKR